MRTHRMQPLQALDLQKEVAKILRETHEGTGPARTTTDRPTQTTQSNAVRDDFPSCTRSTGTQSPADGQPTGQTGQNSFRARMRRRIPRVRDKEAIWSSPTAQPPQPPQSDGEQMFTPPPSGCTYALKSHCGQPDAPRPFYQQPADHSNSSVEVTVVARASAFSQLVTSSFPDESTDETERQDTAGIGDLDWGGSEEGTRLSEKMRQDGMLTRMTFMDQTDQEGAPPASISSADAPGWPPIFRHQSP
jgi:hypothetical protein